MAKKIETTYFNIKFGFPRSDTCSECDKLTQQLNCADLTTKERHKLEVEKEIHLRKTESFFELKCRFKIKAEAFEAVLLKKQIYHALSNLKNSIVNNMQLLQLKQKTKSPLLRLYYDTYVSKSTTNVFLIIEHYLTPTLKKMTITVVANIKLLFIISTFFLYNNFVLF